MHKRGDFMGFFDMFKKEKTTNKEAEKRDNSEKRETELTLAVRKLFANESYENYKNVAKI